MQPAKKRNFDPEPDPNKFDLRTHVWDGSGNLIRTNLYTKYVIDGNAFFERPVKSGNLWYENNQPAGRMEYEQNPKGELVRKLCEGKAHIAYVPKLEGAEALYSELEEATARATAAELELAAIKMEREKRTDVKAEVEAVADQKPATPPLGKPRG